MAKPREVKTSEGGRTPQEMMAGARSELNFLGNYLASHPQKSRAKWEELLDIWLEASKRLRKLEDQMYQLPLPLPSETEETEE